MAGDGTCCKNRIDWTFIVHTGTTSFADQAVASMTPCVPTFVELMTFLNLHLGRNHVPVLRLPHLHPDPFL